METYIQDAEREGDTELATIFRKAEAESRKGAGQGKQLLRQRQLTGPLAGDQHGEPSQVLRGGECWCDDPE